MLKTVNSLATSVIAAFVAASAVVCAPASGQEAFGIAGPAAAQWPIEQQIPLSKSHGAGSPVGVPVITFDKLDNSKLAAEADMAATPGKPRQIGVARPLTLDAGMGLWTDAADGGKVWVLDIHSPGAEGLRVHFTQISLPVGAKLVAYNLNDPTEIGGPYTGRGEVGGESDDLYTPALFSDRLRIEFYLPPGLPAGQLPFDADNLQHLFRNPMKGLTGPGGDPRDGDPDITPTVGNCHNDVTCFPAWANTAKAVGLYIFSTGGGTSQCTGQLIATTAQDLTPYFITAAHCVDTSTEASSVQVFWLFQTATCNGAAPNQGSSPTTSGATLIATRAQSDGTLLRLTGALPGGLFWVGWTSTPVTNGTAVTCIHHPDGSWKRISFATATDAAGCTLGTQSETIDATWTSAVTEPGSSGGGLFRSDTQQIIGTLSCGPSFCGATGANAHDGFGRFASFYPTISAALAGGSDDALEENDTCAASRQLSPVTGTTLNNTGLTVKLTDEDWYKYTLPAGATLTVTLTFTAANGVPTGQLYTTCGGSVLATATGTGGTRTLTYVNTGAADEVYFRVTLTGTNPSNTYDMATLVAQIPLNNACASATTVVSGNTYAGTTVNATNDGTSGCPTTVAARTRPDVWYTFTAPAAGTLTLDTCLTSPTDTVLSVHSACPGTAANQLACNDDALTTGPCSGVTNNYTSYLTLAMTAGQQVYIRVGMWSATAAPFTLRVAYQVTAPSNDLCGGAITIGAGTTAFNTTAAATEATTDTVCTYFSYSGVAKDLWYRHIATCTGEMVVDTCGSSYDTKLAVYSACPSVNNTALACDDDADPACSNSTLNSRVVVPVVSGQIYLIRVGGFRTTGGVESSGAGLLNINCQQAPCPADLGMQGGVAGQDNALDNNDFIVFIQYFFDGNPAADLGVQGGALGSDGLFDNNDFIAFIDLFFAGCP